MLSMDQYAMHIPDGFLSAVVAILFWIPSVTVLVVALRRVSADLGEREVPMMGVLAAAIFAAQMLNFTVAGGTSGHLIGAALATILLGPWAAILVLTCVIGVQALIFQDGGLLAMGANLFNMAVVGVAVAYAIYRLVSRLAHGQKWGLFVGGFAAAWTSVVVAALAAALELALSGTSPANVAIPAMGGIHMLIGIGEGLITVGALAFLYTARRDLLKLGAPQPAGSRAILVGGLLLALALAVLSPLASTHPDGLMSVAERYGFLSSEQPPLYTLIPHYALPGISNQALSTILAGMIGALLVLIVALAVAYSRRSRQTRP